MNRVSQERKPIQVLLRNTDSVSNATWPTAVQRSVNTGWKSQWRRRLLMKSGWLWKGNTSGRVHTPYTPRTPYLSHTFTVSLSSERSTSVSRRHTQIRRCLLAISTACLVFILCTIYTWPMLALISAIMAALIMYLFLSRNPLPSVQQTSVSSKVAQRQQQRKQKGRKGATQKVQQKALPSPTPASTFPATPMPATPLIRILETIDLSSTNVEHFLKTSDQKRIQDQQMGQERLPLRQPESQFNLPIDM